MLDSCSFTHQFKLNFLETEKVAIGQSVTSEDIFAGGHLWTLLCYPRGSRTEDNGVYLSMALQHQTKSESVKAIFEAIVMDKDGTLSSSHKNKFVKVLAPGSNWGWPRFVERSVLESLYVTNGSFIIVCGVKVVVGDDPIEVPPSDIGSHLGLLLDCAEGSDVSFVVDGKKFPAHRNVLAARSPVFKAQLMGSMADANMSSITLHDIVPATFKVMLRFMYTDACPEESELGDYPDEMFRHLLAAADRFALDRLKLLCASKLWDNISVDTVAATLICAETYNCPQLKKKCIDFFGEGKDFKTKALLTEGFAQLVQNFPSILDELRQKLGG
ncbi:BTB/POZ and MATH domain-containing protein 1 [Sorghum bicolor]|jgi:speckle-type POZ protein|nr:BTB/POZ and MATH domain-containing protein 1 [Sorghum bicolor]|eukprot:XP_002444723.1 BTB/POZ and MATH domain-containing protein 1 [Sorghum bicolor]